MNRQMFCSWVLLAMLGVHWTPVRGGLEKTCDEDTRRRGPPSGGVCGSFLADLMQIVCNGNYNYRIAKRSIDPPQQQKPKTRDLTDILLTKRNAFSYLKKRNSASEGQGIVCECCYHQCSMQEMQQYCGEGSSLSERIK